MEREVFENDEVAAFLNANFVCIKVDREERPDLDAVYMQAVQAISGGGGWPMSVFLTPGLEPFFGGTYFPPGPFLDLTRRIVDLYANQREALENNAREVAESLGRRDAGEGGRTVDPALTAGVAEGALERYDARWGGFMSRQKFPVPLRWRFLLHHYRKTGDMRFSEVVRGTLDRMADGGVHDHVGGGFHRYTVDASWLVPHFEIMLYDNAQLAALYLEAAAVFEDARYSEVGLDVLDFLLREMNDDQGGFYASFDADSGGEEGSYYVWTPEELAAVAGDDGPALAALLGVAPGGNFEGRSVLTRRADPADVAARLGRDPGEVAALFDCWRDELRAHRAGRTPPGLDRKIVTAWNGLVLSALAAGHALTGEARYREAAERGADFLWRAHRRADGRLARASTGGVAGGEGVLDDYAFLACGLLDLYGATGERRHLERGLELVVAARRLFTGDDGTAWLTAEGIEAPLGRHSEFFDSVEPSGAAALVHALLQAAALTGDAALRDAAAAMLARRGGELARYEMEMAWWADAALLLAGPCYEVVLAGDPGDAAAEALARAYGAALPPHAVLARVPAAGPDGDLAALLPATAGKTVVEGAAAAYVCRFGACLEPARDPATLSAQLRSGWAR